jgi:hypothetical protein
VVAYLAYVCNVAFSALALYDHSLGSQTWSSFLALVWLQKARLDKCYSIAHSKSYYSAYLSDKTCFNEVDADHDVTIVGHHGDDAIGIVKKGEAVIFAAASIIS